MKPSTETTDRNSLAARITGAARISRTASTAAVLPRRAILIVGMHRSGTSALARVLNLLGVCLGGPLLPADLHNPTGYWEQLELMQSNDRLLKELGTRWDAVWRLPDRWHEHPAAAAHRQRCIECLMRQFGGEILWGVKDPRLSLLLPNWMQALGSLDIATTVVHIFRHPADVVTSLRRRDFLSTEKAYLLWLRYVLEAERNSRHCNRVLISYERLLLDWRSTCARIATAARCRWPSSPSVMDAVAAFLKHRSSPVPVANAPSDNSELTELVDLTYGALCHLESVQPDNAPSPALASLFDLLRERCECLADAFGSTAKTVGLHAAATLQPHGPAMFHTRLHAIREQLPELRRGALPCRRRTASDARDGSALLGARWLHKLHPWIAPDETRRGRLLRLLVLACRYWRRVGLRRFIHRAYKELGERTASGHLQQRSGAPTARISR